MQKKRESLSYVFTVLVYSIFGLSFLFTKEALAIAGPFVLLAFRFAVAFLIVNVFLLTGKFRLNLKGKDIRPLLLLGALQPLLYFVFENYGVTLTPTSFVGTVLALIPIGCLLFGRLLLGERAKPFQIVCAVISVGGVFLTTLGQPAGSFNWVGFLLLLGAVCSAALFNVLSRKYSKEFTSFERTYVMFAMGFVTYLVIALIQSWGNMREAMLAPLLNREFWWPLLYLSAASSVGAFLMLNYAMTHLAVAKTSIFANLTTVISIVAGVLILHENFGIYQAVGSVVILACVYGVNRPSGTMGKQKVKASELES